MIDTAMPDKSTEILADLEQNASIFPALTLHDRCDYDCIQAATAQAQTRDPNLSNLLFCTHHFHESVDALTAGGYLFQPPTTDAGKFTYGSWSIPRPGANKARDTGASPL